MKNLIRNYLRNRERQLIVRELNYLYIERQQSLEREAMLTRRAKALVHEEFQASLPIRAARGW